MNHAMVCATIQVVDTVVEQPVGLASDYNQRVERVDVSTGGLGAVRLSVM